jgi:hypothetical protein
MNDSKGVEICQMNQLYIKSNLNEKPSHYEILLSQQISNRQIDI